MDDQTFHNSIQRLERWLNNNGLAGLDPYTLEAKLNKTSFYQKYGNNRVVRHLCYRLLQVFPEYLLPILKPEPEINAKGLGLLALGYLNLYESTGQETYRQKTEEILTWLVNNRSKGYPGYCWGYPFDWFTEILIPANTPSSVVTVTVGYAFIRAYKLFKNSDYLKVITKIAEFLTKGLNCYQLSKNELCFSYTPLDDKQVINANLFIGDYLGRVLKYFENEEWLRIATKIYNFTIRCQNPDGSFYYYGPDMEPRPALRKTLKMIDHVHTGFVLRALQTLTENLPGNKKNIYIKMGLKFYLEELFDNYIPKFMPRIKYPVNIHSVSEAILTLSQFREDPQARSKLEKTIPWAIANFQDKRGYFYYNLFPFRKAKIAYLRWGQAWMFYALTQIRKNRKY